MPIVPGSVKFIDEAGNELDMRPAAPVQTSVILDPTPSDQLVDAWFVETFHNVSGLTTELYARFFAAKERLKSALRSPPPQEG